MSSKTIQINDALHEYMLSVSLREMDSLKCIREYTAHRPDSNMQISPEQGQLISLIIKLIGAKKIVEIGTFTGYSALTFASAMDDDGTLITIDCNEKTTDIAKSFWKDAGFENRIESKLGEASEILESLIRNESLCGQVDLVFIDADKANYISYYEFALKLIRPKGLVMIDNVLWGGSVIDTQDTRKDTIAIKNFNAHLKNDSRIEMSLVPIGDGLTIARKK